MITPAINPAITPAIGPAIGRSPRLGDLLRGVEWMTGPDADALRTGTRKSIFSDALVPADTADRLWLGPVPFVGIMDGASNLVASDLGAWTASSGSLVVTDQGNGVYRIAFPAFVAAVTFIFSAATVASAAAEFRIVSGTIPDNDNQYFNLRNFATPVGAIQRLAQIGSDWTRITTSVSSSVNTLAIRADVAFTIEVRNIRAVAKSAPYPAFPNAGAAGASYGFDRLSITPTWPAAGTIFGIAVPYGYSGGLNPVANPARIYDAYYSCLAAPGGVGPDFPVVCYGNGFSPTLITGQALTNGQPLTFAFDFDGTALGARANDGERVTGTDSVSSPSGVFRMGNNATGDRPFHGAIAVGMIPRVLSTDEYTALFGEINALIAPVFAVPGALR